MQQCYRCKGWFDPTKTSWVECCGGDHVLCCTCGNARIAKLEADMRDGAGECLVPLPEPGTNLAKAVSAVAILKKRITKLEAEREALRVIVGNDEQMEERYQLLMDFWGMVEYSDLEDEQRDSLIAWCKSWTKAREAAKRAKEGARDV